MQPLRTCKKCGFQSRDLPVFMRHIRSEYPRAKKELTVRQILNNGAATFEKPQLSALDLLLKLKEQRDLMITVCNMIEGVINQ